MVIIFRQCSELGATETKNEANALNTLWLDMERSVQSDRDSSVACQTIQTHSAAGLPLCIIRIFELKFIVVNIIFSYGNEFRFNFIELNHSEKAHLKKIKNEMEMGKINQVHRNDRIRNRSQSSCQHCAVRAGLTMRSLTANFVLFVVSFLSLYLYKQIQNIIEPNKNVFRELNVVNMFHNRHIVDI